MLFKLILKFYFIFVRIMLQKYIISAFKDIQSYNFISLLFNIFINFYKYFYLKDQKNK